MLIILVQWILHKILIRHLQYHLGVELDLCVFDAFVSKSAFYKCQMSISEAK